jgi:capsular polysaccharide biosynthesis protein
MNHNNENITEDEIDLREIFRVFVKRKWWFIGAVLVVLAIGCLYVFMQPVTYTATCRFDIGKDYANDKLSGFYPNKAEKLNFINVDNIPALFRTVGVFGPLGDLKGVKDYDKWLASDSVKISLNENTNIFNVSVSSADKDLAGDIALTLINSFDESITRETKDEFDDLIAAIGRDIELLENKNSNFESVLVGFDEKIDSLYELLDSFIIDYNVELVNEIERENASSNYSFYNLIVPPNEIEDEISEIRKEREFYRQEIFNNQNELMELESLKGIMEEDEEVITDRVKLLTERPVFKSESNRKRNLAVVVVLSLIVGVMVTFLTNFFINLKADSKSKK